MAQRQAGRLHTAQRLLSIKPAETEKGKEFHRKDNGETLLRCWISPYILDWRPAGPPNC